MIRTAIFRCQIPEANCQDEQELNELLLRVGMTIRDVCHCAQIDPRVEISADSPDVQNTLIGGAAIDGYMAVKRAATGQIEYFRNLNGESLPITKAAYDKAHGAH